MFEFLTRLFRGEPSGAKAKERLRLVLLSDHLALAPDVVDAMKTELLEVISRYVEVDMEHVDVTFEQREHEVAMLASVPILSMKAPDERPRPSGNGRPLLVAPLEPAAPAKRDEVEATTTQAAATETAPTPLPEVAPTPPKPTRSRRRRRRKASTAQLSATPPQEPATTPDGSVAPPP